MVALGSVHISITWKSVDSQPLIKTTLTVLKLGSLTHQRLNPVSSSGNKEKKSLNLSTLHSLHSLVQSPLTELFRPHNTHNSEFMKFVSLITADFFRVDPHSDNYFLLYWLREFHSSFSPLTSHPPFYFYSTFLHSLLHVLCLLWPKKACSYSITPCC